MQKVKFAKFDETVELSLRLGVDPKHADQMVRGTVVLPHGLGKSKRVLAIAGSLRAASYNRGLLRAAQEVAPEGMQVELWEHLAAIPPYNTDVEAQGDPEPVAAFKAAIRAADALLIATPEYNRGVPGVLKNALDWASRPALGSPLAGKLVGIVGASTGQG